MNMDSSHGSTTPKDAVSNGLTKFASHLYEVLQKSVSNHENIFLSPLSISEALAMILGGSDRDTEAQMKEVLRLSSIQSSDVHGSVKLIRHSLFNTSDELSIANRIFVQRGFNVSPEFLKFLTEIYDSTCDVLDFHSNSEEAASKINQWVSDSTKGKINEIIDPVSASMSKLVLANAIYFKSPWLHPFDKSQTHLSSFHTSSGQVTNVNMMHMDGRFEIYLHDLLQCDTLWLPYAGGDLGMLIFLPRHRDGLSKIEAAFGPELLETVLNGASMKKASIWLPKFTLEQKYNLEEALKEMGMKDLFDSSKVDLSKLSTTKGLHVTSIVHKTYVDVGEEGTEAAAATTVRLLARSLVETLEFKMDHPFLFCIIHKPQNLLLFIGSLKSPPTTVTTQHQEL